MNQQNDTRALLPGTIFISKHHALMILSVADMPNQENIKNVIFCTADDNNQVNLTHLIMTVREQRTYFAALLRTRDRCYKENQELLSDYEVIVLEKQS